ncbi:MAG TPA: hypothetical protein EYH16_02425 [Leucothrix mucor]|nr:hypothetical protein [Leucothrix mucor]
MGGLIGLDFGSNSIKAVALIKEQGTHKIIAVAEMPIPNGLIIDNHFEDIPKLISMLTQLPKNFPSYYKNVAIAVSCVDVISKVVVISALLSELELESQVEIEAENIIPFPLDEILFLFRLMKYFLTLKYSLRMQTILTKMIFYSEQRAKKTY